MKPEELEKTLGAIPDYIKMTDGERNVVVQHWKKWIASPQVEVVQESTLTEREKKEFIIKDNVSFGQWDWDALANEWDNADLGDWGMDVWTPAPTDWSGTGTGKATSVTEAPVGGVLPPELQGQDLTPDELPKIQGDDETLNDRVIIVYPAERAQEVAELLGLGNIEKVVYHIDELL